MICGTGVSPRGARVLTTIGAADKSPSGATFCRAGEERFALADVSRVRPTLADYRKPMGETPMPRIRRRGDLRHVATGSGGWRW